eukprot:8866534-Alexandrium_andersonii.AAC.1
MPYGPMGPSAAVLEVVIDGLVLPGRAGPRAALEHEPDVDRPVSRLASRPHWRWERDMKGKGRESKR